MDPLLLLSFKEAGKWTALPLVNTSHILTMPYQNLMHLRVTPGEVNKRTAVDTTEGRSPVKSIHDYSTQVPGTSPYYIMKLIPLVVWPRTQAHFLLLVSGKEPGYEATHGAHLMAQRVSTNCSTDNSRAGGKRYDGTL